MYLPKLAEEHWQLLLFISLCAIVLFQFFYYFYFYLRIGWHKEKPRDSSQTHAVSVIVCALSLIHI